MTLARSLTATFAGIRPDDVLPFVAAQLVGAAAAFMVLRWLNRRADGLSALFTHYLPPAEARQSDTKHARHKPSISSRSRLLIGPIGLPEGA